MFVSRRYRCRPCLLKLPKASSSNAATATRQFERVPENNAARLKTNTATATRQVTIIETLRIAGSQFVIPAYLTGGDIPLLVLFSEIVDFVASLAHVGFCFFLSCRWGLC